jgi:hypothetical protein
MHRFRRESLSCWAVTAAWLVLLVPACDGELVQEPSSLERDPTALDASDLALGKPVTASSVERGRLEAAKAVDGRFRTRWSSAFRDPQWISVDLGSTYTISKIKLTWEVAYGRAYRLEVSPDNSTWTTVYGTTTGDGGIDDITGLSASGRYVRMYGTARGTRWGYSLWELEVYGGTSTSQGEDSQKGQTGADGSAPPSPPPLACKPTTCSAQGKNCGSIADGCGAVLQCGSCAAGQTCSSNVCVSSPDPVPAGDPVPVGIPGTWSLKWRDEFDGPSWTIMKPTEWNNSGVNHKAYNCSLANGEAHLILSDPTTGASINTQSSANRLQVGEVVEARVYFPGNGSKIYNWAAWWVSGPNWPAAGEHDIIEILGGSPTVNYHGSSNSQNMNNPFPGQYWGNAFHTYAVYRKAGSAEVWWDGKLARSYNTGDNGQGQDAIVSFGHDSGGNVVTGSAGMIRVDYVRMWRPGP